MVSGRPTGIIIIDDPFRPGEEDTPEYRAKIKWWFTVDMAMPREGVFVGIDPDYDPNGKYGCSACQSSGSCETGRAQPDYIPEDAGEGYVLHDVYYPERVRCKRCLGQGVYVSRARAGLSDL